MEKNKPIVQKFGISMRSLLFYLIIIYLAGNFIICPQSMWSEEQKEGVRTDLKNKVSDQQDKNKDIHRDNEHSDNGENSVKAEKKNIEGGKEKVPQSKSAILGKRPIKILESAYYTNYPNAIILKPFISYTSMDLSIESTESDDRLEFRPNSFANLGISFSWWIFGFSLSSQLKDSIKNPEQYGESTYFDFQFNYYSKYFGGDFNLAYYKGYYIENSTAALEGRELDPKKIILPDLEAAVLGFNLYYIFNPERVSLAAAFDQTAKQNRSGGSFMLMLSYAQIALVNSGPIIPESQQELYGDLGDFSKGAFITLALLPGYVYSFVWRNYFFTPVIFVGLGLQAQGFESPSQTDSVDAGAIALKMNIRLSFGYNADRFFSGISLIDDLNSIENKQGQMTITAQLTSLYIFLGYRF